MNSFHAKIGWKQMRKREIKMRENKTIPLLPHFKPKQA